MEQDKFVEVLREESGEGNDYRDSRDSDDDYLQILEEGPEFESDIKTLNEMIAATSISSLTQSNKDNEGNKKNSEGVIEGVNADWCDNENDENANNDDSNDDEFSFVERDKNRLCVESVVNDAVRVNRFRFAKKDSYPQLFFILLANQSNPNIMYRDLTTYPPETRSRVLHHQIEASKRAFTGMSLVSVDMSQANRVQYNGIIQRTAFRRCDVEQYQHLKPWYVIRDKFFNYKNFANTNWHVMTQRRDRTRWHPKSTNSVISTYFAQLDVPELMEEVNFDEYGYGFFDRPDVPSWHRYKIFYNNMNLFIHNELKRLGLPDNYPIDVYHKLPFNMSWILSDWLTFRKNEMSRLKVYAMPSYVCARNIPVSIHCMRRANHTNHICEICLVDAYAPQLINIFKKKHMI